MADPRGRTGVALALLLTAAVGAAAFGHPVLDERSTSCWTCHADDLNPLETFFSVHVPSTAGAPPGTAFDYTVQVTNTWLHEMRFLEPSLDLSAAPSLRFQDGRGPTTMEVEGVVPLDAAGLLEGAHRGHVVVDLPVGATDATITLQALDPFFTHDLALHLHPGRTEPGGGPIVVDEAGPGQPEVFVAGERDGTSLAALGTGNWSVEAVVPAAKDAWVNLMGPELRFLVTVEADFRANEEPVQHLSRAVQMGPGASSLLTWRLEAVAHPGPGEHAVVRVDAHVHFRHPPSAQGSEDDANVTKSQAIPIARDGEAIVLLADAAPHQARPVASGLSRAAVSEAIGYAAVFLILSSLWTGGVFGKASRRHLNHVFGTAKRRVAFHNAVSYAILLLVALHATVMLTETRYHWSRGLIWGGFALLGLLGLGVTGALQMRLIRSWGFAAWRHVHLATALGVLLFVVVHVLLDGAHFGPVQEAVGWQNPLDPGLSAAESPDAGTSGVEVRDDNL